MQDTLTIISRLKAIGCVVAAVEQAAASNALYTFTPLAKQQYAVVFGHEVFGVQDEVLAACDLCLEIPQHGVKHSLNVSVSMGIVVWELARSI